MSMFLGYKCWKAYGFCSWAARGGEEGRKLASDELEPVGTAGEGCLNG